MGLHYTDAVYLVYKRHKELTQELLSYSKVLPTGLITLRKCKSCHRLVTKSLVHKASNGDYLCSLCYEHKSAVVAELGSVLSKFKQEEVDYKNSSK
jgi:hypothetical protein